MNVPYRKLKAYLPHKRVGWSRQDPTAPLQQFMKITNISHKALTAGRAYQTVLCLEWSSLSTFCWCSFLVPNAYFVVKLLKTGIKGV